MSIDKITNDLTNSVTNSQEDYRPLEKLCSELKQTINEYLLQKNINLQIDPFLTITQNKLEVNLAKFLQDNLQQYLQMEKKELNNALLETARKAFANFLYYLTLQKKATKLAMIEAESFLKYFLVSGSANYHFHIDKQEYLVNFIEFIADPIQDIKEDNPKIKKYKNSIIDISKLLQSLQKQLLNNNELAAEQILLEIKAIIDNTIMFNKENISTKDLLTIQRLQSELTTENHSGSVSPIIIRNNPRVPIYRKNTVTEPVTISSSEPIPEKSFVKQLKRLFQ